MKARFCPWDGICFASLFYCCLSSTGENLFGKEKLGAKSSPDPSQEKSVALLGKSQSRTGLPAFPEQQPESSKPGMWPDSEAQDFCPVSSLQLFVNNPLGLWPSQMNALRMQLKTTEMVLAGSAQRLLQVSLPCAALVPKKKCGIPGQSCGSNSATQQPAMQGFP